MQCDEGRWRLYRCGVPSGLEVKVVGAAGLGGSKIRFRGGDRWSWLDDFIIFRPFAWDISLGLQEVPLLTGGPPHGITTSTGPWDRKAEEFAATDLAWGHGSSWVQGKF